MAVRGIVAGQQRTTPVRTAMFLDYLSLVILLAGLTLVFYTFIYIHELPHKAAERRDHPHSDAIYVATWLSLFTLHAMWPIIYIWAISHKKNPPVSPAEQSLADRIAVLERRLLLGDAASAPASNSPPVVEVKS
jgi:hypothetical protein